MKVLSSKQVELTVDYTYASDHGDQVWVGAYPPNSNWFGYQPQHTVRGDGTATVIVTFGFNNSPNDATTSQMIVYMYNDTGSIYAQSFDYPLTWSLGPTPTPTDTPVPALPDLQIQIAQLALTNCDQTPQQSPVQCDYQLGITILNASPNAVQSPFFYSVAIGQVDFAQEYQLDNGALNRGTAQISLQLGRFDDCRTPTCHVQVTVDSHNDITESDETNNVGDGYYGQGN